MKLCNLLRLILFLPKFIHCSTNEYAEFYDDYNKIRSKIDRQNIGNISNQYYDYDYYDYYDVISSEIKGLEKKTDITVNKLKGINNSDSRSFQRLFAKLDLVFCCIR